MDKRSFYHKVPETKKQFSLFCTVFTIWKHLEAFGSWICSLFCTVFTVRKHLEADCFRYFAPFWHWKDKSAKTVKLPNASKTVFVILIFRLYTKWIYC